MDKQKYFLIVALAYVFVYFHRNSMAVLSLPIEVEFSFGITKMGLLGAAYLYTYSLMQIPAGILADRINPARLLVASLLISALGSTFFAAGGSYATLFAGRILLGLGTGLFFVPSLRFLASKYPTSEFVVKSGILITFGNLGAILATFPLALAGEYIGWRFFIILIAILSFLLMFGLRGQAKTDHSFVSEKQEFNSRVFMQAMGNVNIHLIAFWLFSFCATKITFIGLWAGPFMKDIYGFNQTTIGIVLFAAAVGVMIGSPLSGYFCGRYSARAAFLGGSFLYTLWWLMMTLYPLPLPAWAAAASFFIMGLTGGCFIIAFTWSKQLCAGLSWGLSMGYINSVGFLGTALMMPLSGLILAALEDPLLADPLLTGYRTNFAIFTLLMALATALLYLFVKERPHDSS